MVGTAAELELNLDDTLTGLMGWGWPEEQTTTPVWLAYLQKVFTRLQFAVLIDHKTPRNSKMTVGYVQRLGQIH